MFQEQLEALRMQMCVVFGVFCALFYHLQRAFDVELMTCLRRCTVAPSA